jgi:hypothetical protein
MRTTTPGPASAYRHQRPPWRRPLIAIVVIAALLAVGTYAAYTAYHRYVVKLLTVPGCQAGTGADAVALDFGQATDAAVIAGVAVREHLPARAVTIAYATAWQESKLENLSYGDRDSVGIFQQRPSMGWGTKTQLEDPAYAAQVFFGALVKVKDWQTIPVYQAAQDVQESADGYAYQQYGQTGAAMTSAYLTGPHAVTCWYDPVAQAASQDVSTKLNLSGALKGLGDTFGQPGEDGPVTKVSTARSGDSVEVSPAKGGGWAVANWVVANASNYGITKVSYDGYQWSAQLTETSWQSDPGAPAGGIVAS